MDSVYESQNKNPFKLVMIRLTTMFVLAATTYAVLKLTGISNDFPPLDALYFPFVNIICGIVIWREFRRHKVSVWRYLGFEKGRIGKDIGWGFLWLFVTYIPMVIVLMAGTYLMFGAEMFQNFEHIFAKSSPGLPKEILMTTSLFGAVLFLINAPIEEIVYRGWLQNGLAKRWGIAVAIAVQGLLFGLQHMMFASDWRGMVIYGLMFMAWGMTAGIIVHRQQRLAPMAVAHWIVNIALGVGPMMALAFLAA